jgi:Arc/MetJ-type ribon-helix-helix transcriptional regulator
MKVSVSLPEDVVAYIDEYAHRTGAPSRSSVLHRAVALLRLSELEQAYGSAWDEWDETEDAQMWDRASGDGLADATR